MSEWVTHSGLGMPVSETEVVECMLRDGSISGPWPALEFHWDHIESSTDVIAFRTQEQHMKANDIQVAGDHYKKLPIQAWDFIAANNIGFFEGNAIKYLTRWRDKGGVEDLRKAKHYIEKLIELQEQA